MQYKDVNCLSDEYVNSYILYNVCICHVFKFINTNIYTNCQLYHNKVERNTNEKKLQQFREHLSHILSFSVRENIVFLM